MIITSSAPQIQGERTPIALKNEFIQTHHDFALRQGYAKTISFQGADGYRVSYYAAFDEGFLVFSLYKKYYRYPYKLVRYKKCPDGWQYDAEYLLPDDYVGRDNYSLCGKKFYVYHLPDKHIVAVDLLTFEEHIHPLDYFGTDSRTLIFYKYQGEHFYFRDIVTGEQCHRADISRDLLPENIYVNENYIYGENTDSKRWIFINIKTGEVFDVLSYRGERLIDFKDGSILIRKDIYWHLLLPNGELLSYEPNLYISNRCILAYNGLILYGSMCYDIFSESAPTRYTGFHHQVVGLNENGIASPNANYLLIYEDETMENSPICLYEYSSVLE